MASAMGYNAGGHTFKIFDEEEGVFNTSRLCTLPPEDEAEGNIEELQANVTRLLAELGVLLEAAGIYNPAATSGYAVHGHLHQQSCRCILELDQH